jgi:hypothetical protein
MFFVLKTQETPVKEYNSKGCIDKGERNPLTYIDSSIW